MQQLHAIEYPKKHPKSLKHLPRSPRLHGDIREEVGPMLVSFWAHPGFMFELFQGARLLLFACCFPIAGALFLMCPLLR